MAYDAKLRHDRAVTTAYQREHRHLLADAHGNDRAHFLRRLLQDGLVRLSPEELVQWAELQQRLAERGAVGTCSGMHSPRDERSRAMSIDALTVDEVAQYLKLSYQAIHDEAVEKQSNKPSSKRYSAPNKWRVQAAQVNLAAQVVGLIAQHPEDAKRLGIFEAEGEKKTAADQCWMAALGMRAALRLQAQDRDIILRSLVARDID